MSTLIHVYSDETAASGVVKQLKEAGYNFFVVSGRDPDGSTRSKEAVIADLTDQRLDRAVAEAYEVELAKGGTLVGVQPMFGNASKAAKILDSVASVDTGIEREHATNVVDWSADPTPVSNVFGWPILVDHDASLSEALRLPPLLAESGSFFSWFGFRLLSDDVAPVSKLLGVPVLLDNPTPLSTKLGIPVLTDE
jgi:hypothetical protein